jgi:UDP-N-acetylmuramoyl-tripeptide--D-alanyl-D-alanine ligase
MQGELTSGDLAAVWQGAALDSRRIGGGELFFALAGEHTDGHRFVGDALSAGAAAAVVDHRPLPEADLARGALIRVESPYAGLHDLTRAIRRQVPERLVAVTGSSGKTTTKALLAAMLARRYRVAASPGNLNNLYGFPLALLGIPDDTEWMVAEMGMSTPDELRRLSLLGRPDVAVFTNVREVHLEGLGSLAGIARAKAELLAGLDEEGLVVANADDPHVRWIASLHPGEVVFYGRVGGEVTASAVEPLERGVGTRFRLHAGGESVEVELPLFGEYNVDNCLAAAACAHRLGVGLGEIAAAVAEAAPQPMRGVVRQLADGGLLIDDSYNSNPDAAVRALEGARELAAAVATPRTRAWAVLGQMLELGPAAPEHHRRVGRRAAELGVAPVFGVGELARELVDAAREAGAEACWFPTAAEAATAALGELSPGDVLLVKGSRGVGLERLVEAILERERG